MRKPVQIALAVLLVGAGVIAWQVQPEREALYQGKGLSVWLKQYYDALENPESPMTCGATYAGTGGGEASAKQAQAAILEIGTNALPVLLRMAEAHDSALKQKWMVLYYRFQGAGYIPWSLVRFSPRGAEVFQGMAALGFYTLGSSAKPAVPALTRLLGDNNPDVRASIARALRFMGDVAQDAVATLLKCLRDKDADTRLAAAEALKRIDPEAVAKAGVK
jgi:hypothetical protein